MIFVKQKTPDELRISYWSSDLCSSDLSNGIAVGPDGMLYVSTGSQLAGAGAVIKVDPGEARDPAAAPACDPDDVPGANFDDVGANIHREAIDCLGWWGIILGRTDATFEPGSRVRRDQVAAIVARLIGSASDLPEPDTDAFSDDDGNVHEESINQLAAAGVMLGKTGTTFDPSAPVTRGQVASILARAYAVLAGSQLAAGDDSFTDDDGTPHEAAIDAVAAAGWVNGVDADRSEEHTSELQSLMRISYAVFCLQKKTHHTNTHINNSQ